MELCRKVCLACAVGKSARVAEEHFNRSRDTVGSEYSAIAAVRQP